MTKMRPVRITNMTADINHQKKKQQNVQKQLPGVYIQLSTKTKASHRYTQSHNPQQPLPLSPHGQKVFFLILIKTK